MIAVKNPNELACCKCKYQNKYRCSNGWTCSLTLEEGYPCYADACDRLDNCPFNSSPIEHRYAYGTNFTPEKLVINCKTISLTIGGIAIELENKELDEINIIEVNDKKFVKMDNRKEKR